MQHFFILGCPRSGTTMLQQALNRHPEIVIPPETKFFSNVYRRSGSVQAKSLERINSDLRISLPPGQRANSAGAARKMFQEAAQLYIDRLGRREVDWFGEKTPEHTSHLASVRETFPEAPIVFMYRDGRDVALSLSKTPWMKCNLYVGMVIWLYYYHFLKAARRDPNLRVCWVRYEDLTAKPTAELQRIAAFLQLEFEPAMAEGFGNREGIPDRELPWKERALRPITIERVGAWRRELTLGQVGVLERLGNHALRDLGYSLASPEAPRLSPIFYLELAAGILGTLSQLPWRSVVGELARG